MLKRIFDLFCSSIGIIFISPLFLLIAVWIKLDSPGSILFKQVRVGRFGKEFQIYKFRTMVVNAEQLGAQITTAGDQRITRSGKFLRQYKLDELPQLFNVWKGEMSLVGPRPEVPKYVALYTPEQRQVLNVRPGITDLASIQFRHESELLAASPNPEEFYVQDIMPKKLELNQNYIHKANLSFDFYIILQTLKVIFSHTKMSNEI